jgi:hypothetical protein
MPKISVGPNGLFVTADGRACCGEFERDAVVAAQCGRLLNRHGEELTLTTEQKDWLNARGGWLAP